MVHLPDILVTPTSIVAALDCHRRPIIASRVQSFGTSGTVNKDVVWGGLVHQVVQEYLNQRVSGISALEEVLKTVLKRNARGVSLLDIPLSKIEDGLRSRAYGVVELSAFLDGQNNVSAHLGLGAHSMH